MTGRKIGIFRCPNKLFSGNSLKKIHVNKGLQHTLGEMALIIFQFTTLSCAKGSKRLEKMVRNSNLDPKWKKKFLKNINLLVIYTYFLS